MIQDNLARCFNHIEKRGACWVWTGYYSETKHTLTPVFKVRRGRGRGPESFQSRSVARYLWEQEGRRKLGPRERLHRRETCQVLCVRPTHHDVRDDGGRIRIEVVSGRRSANTRFRKVPLLHVLAIRRAWHLKKVRPMRKIARRYKQSLRNTQAITGGETFKAPQYWPRELRHLSGF